MVLIKEGVYFFFPESGETFNDVPVDLLWSLLGGEKVVECYCFWMMRLDIFKESLIVAPTPRTLLSEVFQTFLVDPDDDDIIPDCFIIQRLLFHAIIHSSLQAIKETETMK